MDLSFVCKDQDVAITALPADLAVLLVGVAARQAASPTARVANRLAMGAAGAALLAPASGAFNTATAALLMHRKGM